MYIGKYKVFDAFISHVDEINKMPKNSKVLSGNKFTNIQSIDVQYKKWRVLGRSVSPGI